MPLEVLRELLGTILRFWSFECVSAELRAEAERAAARREADAMARERFGGESSGER